MGKGGRVLCIITPYALTIASLVCLIIVGLGCTNSGSSTLNDLYFFRADLQNMTTTASSKSTVSQALSDAGVTVSDGDISAALEQVQKQFDLKDFYNIGLWGYCDGNVTNNDFEVSECSKPKGEFWFNPIEVWNLEETGVENGLPSGLRKSLNLYKNVSKWMFIAYIVAFVATVVELVVGVFAICSRWGSCVTTLISGVAFLFTAAASVTATAMFATVTGAFNENLKDYGMHGSMGKNIYVTTWLAVAFSLGAALFWMLSTCCCSGRSPYNHKNTPRGVTAEKTPYTYEPLGPQGNQQASPYNTSYPPPPPPTQNRSNAYEPFRHV
ncbi:integral membrane protein [Aspergillus bombycis]|uniref:Integral membrane protein n=1 Tax=Aspergillus bombycis TaxID=109264 RepID=A0A1F7ZM02_9EURO|nr:integral membrane protein [Aspergillus bombycis]OGM40480.1 integral membrane protein [Aspergillus bombycis]